jgi:hypothetical protein
MTFQSFLFGLTYGDTVVLLKVQACHNEGQQF